MFESPEFWVAIAFVLFVAALLKFRVPGMVFKALDARSDAIRTEIDEAKALREEAQKALAEYKRKQRDALKEAEAIIEHAKVEAERVRQQAHSDLDAALKRREQATLEKIAQAEAKALQEVHDLAVDVALAATSKLLTANMDQKTANALVDESIKGLADKLH